MQKVGGPSPLSPTISNRIPKGVRFFFSTAIPRPPSGSWLQRCARVMRVPRCRAPHMCEYCGCNGGRARAGRPGDRASRRLRNTPHRPVARGGNGVRNAPWTWRRARCFNTKEHKERRDGMDRSTKFFGFRGNTLKTMKITSEAVVIARGGSPPLCSFSPDRNGTAPRDRATGHGRYARQRDRIMGARAGASQLAKRL